MGVLNTTPDSFSDGGNFLSTDKAIAHGLHLLESGADILDIGGMSTRPGAVEVSADEERARTYPVIKAIRVKCPEAILSIDTMKAEVAEAALEAGADIINDVRGLADEPRLAELAATSGAGLILMHSSGTPDVMQSKTQYNEFPGDILRALEKSAQVAERSGVRAEQIILDPGFGFGKTAQQSTEMLQHVQDFAALGYALLCGLSRKSFLGWITGVEIATERDVATHTAGILCLQQGAQILRVHDVIGARDSLAVWRAYSNLLSEKQRGPGFNKAT